MFSSLYNYLLSILPHAIFIAKGIIVTIKYSMLSVFFGLILGVLIAVCKISHNIIIRKLANIYTSIFRGTPLLIQLSIIYFGLPSVLNVKISILVAGVLSFSLNSAAYVSEIIKAGITSIDPGQFEAAKVLNVPKYYIYKDIIMPQAVATVFPALINELIDLVKESAIISFLGESDLMYQAQLVSGETYRFFMPMCIAGIYYYIIIMFLSYLSKIVERKFSI